MLDLVEKETGGICQSYIQEVGNALPEDVQNDPFAIFSMYKSAASFEKKNEQIRTKQRPAVRIPSQIPLNNVDDSPSLQVPQDIQL